MAVAMLLCACGAGVPVGASGPPAGPVANPKVGASGPPAGPVANPKNKPPAKTLGKTSGTAVFVAAASPKTASTPLAVVAVVASSALNAWKHYTFSASNLLDGKLDTSWQPAHKRSASTTPWVRFDLGTPKVITGFDIANGLQRRDALGDLFALNGRLGAGWLSFDDGGSEPVALEADARGRVPVVFRAPHRTRYVRLTVVGAYPGDKWPQTAISEVWIHGYDSGIDSQLASKASGPIECGTPRWLPFREAVIDWCGRNSDLACPEAIDVLVGCVAVGNNGPEFPPPLLVDRANSGRLLYESRSASGDIYVTFVLGDEGWRVGKLELEDEGHDHE